jgi:radical SAM-linked protein
VSDAEQPRCRSPEKAQRLRIRFARGPEAVEVGHLDVSRVWDRAFEAAGIAVSYSEGKHPRPRITQAAALPGDATSDGELVDAVLARLIPPAEVPARVQPHLPPGIELREALEVGMGGPSLPSLARWADYEVDVPADPADVERRVNELLASATFPWEDTRAEKVRRYDLRALVQSIAVERLDGATRLRMRLRCESGSVGRPEQVALALELPAPARIHRARLVLAEVSPAREAWRRRGRFVT